MTRKVLGVFVLLLMLGGATAAQELAGQITGTVTDQQDAVVSGARVTAVHVATNITYRATTSDLGRFIIPKVRIGIYRVIVEVEGFKRAVIEGVEVQVGSTADVNVTLELGDIQDEVTVTASTAQEIINTVSAELGGVVDQREVLQLPLNGRNAVELAILQPGVLYETDQDGAGNKFFVHGQRHRATNFTLDGVDTQDNLNRASSVIVNQPLLAMTAENVEEFKVVTGISSAEYARGGSQVSAVTRSGGNEFHGSLFWFHRNDAFSANNWFNNRVGEEVPKRIRNQFGGRIGGPIWKDKLFFFFGYQQTRDIRGIPVLRTVYTAEAKQGIFRYLDNLTTTPENVAANPGLIRSVNLLECGANVQAKLGRDCVDSRFGGSMPFTTVDSFIVGEILDKMPLPNNFEVGDGLNTGGFRFNAKTGTFEHLPAFRLDYRINDNHLFYGTVHYTDRNIDGDFINGRETIFPAFGPAGRRLTHTRAFTGALASTFGATKVNELRVGWAGGENAFDHIQPADTLFQLDLNDVTDPYTLGGDNARDNVNFSVRDVFSWIRGSMQWKFGGEFRHRQVENVSFFETDPFGEIDFGRGDNPPGFSETNLRAMSTGGPVSDIETVDFNNAQDQINNLVGAIGQVEMTYNITSLESGFVLGAPDRRKYRNEEVDLFVQNNWNVLRNLTLNLGLRWEYSTVPVETRGLSLVPDGGADAVFAISGPQGFFNPGTFSGTPCPQLASIPVVGEPTATQALDLILSCAVPNVPGGANNGRPFYDDDFNDFGPVVGFAWDPFSDGKTSIRGGYRLSYMREVFSVIDGNLDDNEGLSVNQDCEPVNLGNCSTNHAFLRDVISSGTPAISPAPPFVLPVVRTFLNDSAQDFRTYDEDLKTAYYHEWTFGIQRELLRNWAVEIRYVGNKGVNLWRVADFNEYNLFARDPNTGMNFLEAFIIAQRNLACNRANGAGDRFDDLGFPCNFANPLMDVLFAGDPLRLYAQTSGFIDALEFNETGEFLDELLMDRSSRTSTSQSTGTRFVGGSFWGAVLRGQLPANFFNANPFLASSRRMVSDGFSTYHGLEVEVRRRPVGGLLVEASYTFNRAISDFDGDENTLVNDTRPSSVINPRYTSGDFMPRHLIKGTYIYELPFGRGRRFPIENTFLDKIFGGWDFGGIINWRSGRPFSILSGNGTFHRTAISANNTVNLTQGLNISQLRKLGGRQSDAQGIFWFDPCLSAVNQATCINPNTPQGLFTVPNPGQLGKLMQTPFFGPQRFVFDFNLTKVTQITEQYSLEFRWEVFNAFNNPNFGLPDNNIFSRSFGQIFSTTTEPRLMQFALKVNF